VIIKVNTYVFIDYAVLRSFNKEHNCAYYMLMNVNEKNILTEFTNKNNDYLNSSDDIISKQVACTTHKVENSVIVSFKYTIYNSTDRSNRGSVFCSLDMLAK